VLDNSLLEIIAPAFVVGVMIALTHAPLGIEVLKRGIIFMDLAIAQFAALGLVIAQDVSTPIILQIIALSCALGGAFIFRMIEKILPQYQEAVIGSFFVGAASLTLLLLANNPHGGEEVQEMLSGQMLFVTWRDIFYHLPIYLFVLICWFMIPKARDGFWFYGLFALAITSSVQLVGVYLVFASLILPALSVIYFPKNKMVWAWCSGLLSVTIGLFCATIFDMPAGPVIVTAYILCGIVMICISNKCCRN